MRITEWDSRTCEKASLGGHLHCLQYAHELGCLLTPRVLANAALGGHLGCLQYALQHGLALNHELCSNAAMHGHLHLLMYLHEEKGCEWDWVTTYNSAQYGHENCLRYAVENGCAICSNICEAACRSGNLNCLVFLCQRGAEISVNCTYEAARHGHVQCLKYLHEHGCLLDCHTIQLAAAHGSTKSMLVSAVAATSGSLACLKYLIGELQFEMTIELFQKAMEYANIECVQYLVEAGSPFMTYQFKWILRNPSRVCDANFRACLEFIVGCGWNMKPTRRFDRYDCQYTRLYSWLPLSAEYLISTFGYDF